MKSTKVVKIISLIFFLFIVFLGPAFIIRNSYKSIGFTVFFDTFSYYSVLLFLSVILIFMGVFLDVIFKPNNIIKLLEILFALTSFLILSFFINFYTNTYKINCTYSFISYLIFIADILLLLKCFSDLFEHNKFTVPDIVEIGIFVSLAIVFDQSFFKIKISNQGGSISIAMLPLFLICLRKGFFKGFITCSIIFGLITCTIDGYGFASYPFDYFLGFGSIALIALFNQKIFPSSFKFTINGLIYLILGFIIAVFARLCFATMSGIFIYKMNFFGSLVYQLAYIGPSSAIVLAILILLYKPLLMISKRFAYTNK